MLGSFRDTWLQDFHADGKHHRRIPKALESALARKLDIIAAAESSSDLIAPPSNRFEHLRGKLSDKCSIRVNRQYRLIFKWDEESSKANNIYLDAHTYR